MLYPYIISFGLPTCKTYFGISMFIFPRVRSQIHTKESVAGPKTAQSVMNQFVVVRSIVMFKMIFYTFLSVTLLSAHSYAGSLKKTFDGTSLDCQGENSNYGEVLVSMKLESDDLLAVSLLSCVSSAEGQAGLRLVKDLSSVQYEIGDRQRISNSYSNFELVVLSPQKAVKFLKSLKSLGPQSKELVSVGTALSSGDEVFIRAQRKTVVNGEVRDAGVVAWGSYVLLP